MFRTNKGFTMIELLLVISIISILGGLGLSSFKGAERLKMATVANEIQTLIRTVQTKAYGQQNTHTVLFDYNKGKCFHIQNMQSMNQIVIPDKITMSKTNFPKGKLYFASTLSPNQGGTIILNSKSYKKKITVLPATGRVKIYPTIRK